MNGIRLAIHPCPECGHKCECPTGADDPDDCMHCMFMDDEDSTKYDPDDNRDPGIPKPGM